MKTGIVFGTFAPMHQGHINLIQRAKKQCDKVVVVVSGYSGDRGDLIGLDVQRRFRYAREVFADDELVEVVKVVEDTIPKYPKGWSEWLKLLKQETKLSDLSECIFFVSESEYADTLKGLGYQVALSERKFGISATMIRENPLTHWNYIAFPFRRHFTKKVLILGSASNGKTTLTKDLGLFFNAPVSLEYARKYQLENNVRDEELVPKDYFYLLLGQYDQTSKIIDGKYNNGLVIADTNSVVTKAYFDYYHPFASGVDVDAFEKLFESIVRKEDWDLILFVEPTGDYVDDGFRDMSMSSDDIRQDFSSKLKLLLAKTTFANISGNTNCDVVKLDGSYLENYEDSINAINKLLK